MKTHFWKIGWRTGKTVIAVFLCFFIDTMRGNSLPYFATVEETSVSEIVAKAVS